MIITQDIYEAAYAKVNGFEIGRVYKVSGDNRATVEIKGDRNRIQECIDEYHNGGMVNAQAFMKEAGFIRYLAMNC